jgi:hypothetical protein
VKGAEEARNRIVAFHNAYVRYVEARVSGNSEEAHRLRMEMADSSLAVQRDLDKVNLGIITLFEAPALGGGRSPASLVNVVLTRLADDYNIDPAMIQVTLRQAASEYERLALEPQDAVVLRELGRGLRFILLLPAYIFVAAARVVRRHFIAATVVLGLIASFITILTALRLL